MVKKGKVLSLKAKTISSGSQPKDDVFVHYPEEKLVNVNQILSYQATYHTVDQENHRSLYAFNQNLDHSP